MWLIFEKSCMFRTRYGHTRLLRDTKQRTEKAHTLPLSPPSARPHTLTHKLQRKAKMKWKTQQFLLQGKSFRDGTSKGSGANENTNTLCPIMTAFSWLVLFRACLCVLTRFCQHKTHIGHNIFGFVCGAVVKGFTNLPHLWNTTIRIIPIMCCVSLLLMLLRLRVPTNQCNFSSRKNQTWNNI